MRRKISSLNVDALQRPGKHIVTELDDEVEVILDQRTITDIKNGQKMTSVIRVIDRKRIRVSSLRILWALNSAGVIDYLDESK